LQYNFNTIRDATNGFADSNKLGQGGFGAVYRVRFHFSFRQITPLRQNMVYPVTWGRKIYYP